MNKKLQKFLTILIILTCLEGLYLFSSKKEEIRQDIKQVISNQTSKIKDPIKKDILTIKLALNAYATAHGGKMPSSLSLLVPKFLVKIPINPETKKTYNFRVENNKPIIEGDNEDISIIENLNINKNEKIKLSKEEEKELVNSLNNTDEKFKYDSRGKRDPFVKFDANKSDNIKKGNTPLEQYDISQLKLTAIISDGTEQKAIIEDISGKGFFATKGAKIGIKGGIITDIQENKVIVTETTIDFTGKTTTEIKEMTLRK